MVIAWHSSLVAQLHESSLCWSCFIGHARWRQKAHIKFNGKGNSNRKTRLIHSGSRFPCSPAPREKIPTKARATTRRRYSLTGAIRQEEAVSHSTDNPVWPNTNAALFSLRNTPVSPIRSKLREWQAEKGNPLAVFPSDIDLLDAGSSGQDPHNNSDSAEETSEPFSPLASWVWERDGSFQDKLASSYSSLALGDLVDYSSSATQPATLAIFVKLVGRQAVCYTIDGKVLFRPFSTSPLFRVPQYATAEELEAFNPWLPNEEVLDEQLLVLQNVNPIVPRTVTLPLLTRMREFKQRSEEIYRANSASLDTAHSILAHASEIRLLTPKQIAEKLLGLAVTKDHPHEAIYAVFTNVLRRVIGISLDPETYLATDKIAVQPKSYVNVYWKVTDWVRAYQELQTLQAVGDKPSSDALVRKADVLTNFIRKCKKLIAYSRRTRRYIPESGLLAASKDLSTTEQSPPPCEIDQDESEIVQFLVLICNSQVLRYTKSLSSIASFIVRAIDCYPEEPEIRPQTVWNLLQEIGIVRPFDVNYDPSHHIAPPKPSLKKEVELLIASIQDGASLEMVDGENDSLRGLRRDFGDMAVYALDSASTTLVDDGISVESIGDLEDEFWIHIHVANISAFSGRRSVVGRLASYNAISLYLPNRTEPMLPVCITKQFSLAAGKPTLTFSTRLHKDGGIKDYKIQPGIIHNVVSYDRKTVNNVLQPGRQEPVDTILWIGAREQKKLEERQLSEPPERHKLELSRLYNLVRARRANRSDIAGFDKVTNDGISVIFPDDEGVEPSLYEKSSQPKYSASDPKIVWRHHKEEGLGSSSAFDTMVEECMIMANYCAASFAKARNLPIIYTGTQLVSPDFDLNLMKQRAKMYFQHGLESLGFKFFIENYVRQAFSTTPMPHEVLQLSSYTTVTSPLRRCRDLVNNWQIGAALREEARLGHRLDVSTHGPDSAVSLPYTHSTLESLLSGLKAKELQMKSEMHIVSKHWAVQFMLRAHFGQECELPRPLTALVMQRSFNSPNGNLWYCKIDGVGINTSVFFTPSRDYPPPKIGDTWEIQITHVETFTRLVMSSPVRLVSRDAGFEHAANVGNAAVARSAVTAAA